MTVLDSRSARFDQARARGYDDTVARALPGYGLVHDIAATVTHPIALPD
ncbi:hypothetical protein [Pararhodospirillum photometricum]|nr:hypothetical protein [Pararhodospirillum photometricum]